MWHPKSRAMAKRLLAALAAAALLFGVAYGLACRRAKFFGQAGHHRNMMSHAPVPPEIPAAGVKV